MIFARQFWRRRSIANIALLPLSVIFRLAVAIRRRLYSGGILRIQKVRAPVVIIGDIVVGGGGKTPLVIALAQALQKRGLTPAIASRGYGGDYRGALMVDTHTSWRQCGDEPLLIYRRAGAPVCVAQKRFVAAQMLARQGCDIILCDDGLQHYALYRDLEIAVINANFGLGNQWHLPAGPLRESLSRLNNCDHIIICGEGDYQHPQAQAATLSIDGFYSLSDSSDIKTAADFADKKVVAIAGIADPNRFFDSIKASGIDLRATYPLSDHARMDDAALNNLDADIILMTEKDAVKYPTDDSRFYAMRITAHPPPALIDAICGIIS